MKEKSPTLHYRELGPLDYSLPEVDSEYLQQMGISRVIAFARETNRQEDGMPLIAWRSLSSNLDLLFDDPHLFQQKAGNRWTLDRSKLSPLQALDGLYKLVPPDVSEETKQRMLLEANARSRVESTPADLTLPKYHFLVDYCKWEINQAASVPAQ